MDGWMDGWIRWWNAYSGICRWFACCVYCYLYLPIFPNDEQYRFRFDLFSFCFCFLFYFLCRSLLFLLFSVISTSGLDWIVTRGTHRITFTWRTQWVWWMSNALHSITVVCQTLLLHLQTLAYKQQQQQQIIKKIASIYDETWDAILCVCVCMCLLRNCLLIGKCCVHKFTRWLNVWIHYDAADGIRE